MTKSNVQKGNETELLFVKWLKKEGYTVHRAARAGFIKLPNGKSFCQSHDMFGALDILAFRDDSVWAVQMTSQSGRSARRAKVSAIEWPPSWKVSIISHETTQDPNHRARKLHFWKVENLNYENGGWYIQPAVQFSKKEVVEHGRTNKTEES